MCLNNGRIAGRHLAAVFLSTALVLSAPILPGDSGAAAGALKNSVRVGDRSAMTIVRPPKAGERRLPVLSRRPVRPPAVAESQAWFWNIHHPTALPDARRWSAALQTLRHRRAQGLALAAQSRLRDIALRFGAQIGSAARKYGVSESLLLAVIAVESAGQSRAVSGKGAQGLMQLIPATARRFGVANSFDPDQNIRGGAAYLDWLLKEFGEDIILALAGYNAGEGAVQKYKGVPPYTETRDYVVKVIDALAAAEGLCAAPPDGPRRPCSW